MRKLLLLFALSISSYTVQAQAIDAEPEVSTVCGGGSANLTATVIPAGSPGAPGSLPTTDYAISSIPFSTDPLNAGTPVSLTDDSQTGLNIPIGFTFCYFGNQYTLANIGSNNWLSFSDAQSTTYTPQAIPSAVNFPVNAILGPFQDINPGAGGTVMYATYGTAPFRRFVVSWNNVPMFSCTGQLYSSQIIIYETTNMIETHIANKSVCAGWVGGRATHGLQNTTGTFAVVVPGRNNTQWTASNEGTRFTPNGTATYTINWYILPANTLIGTGPTITVTPVTSPQYYYAEVVGPNGCNPTGSTANNTDTVVVFSSSLAVDAGPYTAICENTSTTLNAFAPGGTIYTWAPATGLSNPTIPNPIASPTTTTTYTVNITDALGCSGVDTVTIAVNPAPFVDAGFGAAICLGDNIQLSGNGGGTFGWSPAVSLDNASISTPTATPTVTTTYTLTITDGIGCTATDTATVFISNGNADAGPTSAICDGTSTTLNATGGTTYTWAASSSLSATNISNPVANPTSTTTYTVTIDNSSTGCITTDTVTIFVNNLPNVNAGATLLICAGSTANLSATGATNYAWTPTTSLNNPNIPNPTSTATTTTLYTVTGTDLNGCSASDTVSVIVNPVPNANAGNDTSICLGSNTILNATGGTSYSWAPATGLSNPSIGNPVASPTTTTTYTVTVTSAFCSATAQVTITVNPVPTAGASTSNATICSGASTQLTATGGGNYVWIPTTGLSNSTIANPIAAPSTTTTYSVIVSNVSGCSDTATVTINVTNAMSIAVSAVSPETCGDVDGTITTGTITGGNTPYTYSLNGGASQSSSTFSGLAAGTYTVTVTDATGCTASTTATVSQVLGVNASFTANPPSGVYPLNVAFSNSTTGATNYIWDFDNGSGSTLTNPSTVYPNVGQYTVTLIAYNNNPACADTATFIIDVYDEVLLAIPNVFTPNGDGSNDFFFVRTSGVTEISGTIFNRWGKKITEWNGTPSSTLGWDGKINGNVAADGAYYYIINAKGADGKEYEEKGYLQLINGN